MSEFNDDFPTGVTPPENYSYGPPPAPQSGMYPPQPGMPMPQPPKKSNKVLWIVLAVLGVLLLCGIASCAAVIGLVSARTAVSSADVTKAEAVLDKLNTASAAKDTVAYDALWDRAAVTEYLLPKLFKAIETGDSWNTVVEKSGGVTEARALIVKVLTPAAVEEQLGRPFLDQGSEVGTYKSVEMTSDGAVITVDTTSGGTMTLNMDSNWVVVGFDSSEFIDGFVVGFDEGILGS